MVPYFVLSFFPRDVLNEILDCIESVPENVPTYFFIFHQSGNFMYSRSNYNRPLVVRTLMTGLPRVFRTRSWIPWK